MNKQEILTYIEDNIASMSYKEMAEELGMSAEGVRGRAKRAGLHRGTRTTRRTKDSYNKELLDKGCTLLLEEEFTRVGDKLLHKCTYCGYSEYKKPQDVLATPKCTKCVKKRTTPIKPLELMLSELPEQYEYLQGYQGYSKPCTFQCKICCNEYTTTPYRVIVENRCPGCASIASANSHRSSLDEVKNKCKSLGLEFLDAEYANNKHQHTIRNTSCGHTFKYRVDTLKQNTCRVCSDNSSSAERSIKDFISEYGFFTEKGKLPSGKELDILVPELNLAIEYNGMYWHSSAAGKSPEYHLSKTLEAENLGLQLIHIFEQEYIEKEEIVYSLIANALGLGTKIYARKCQIREVPKPEAKNFLEDTHIQGSTGASVNLGLYYNEELISLMTFGKARFNSAGECELLRFSSKLYTSVIGGASKLFSHFINKYNPSSVISYSHRHLFTGALYKTLGFKQTHYSSPSYRYYSSRTKQVLSRFQCQKAKLLEKYPEVCKEGMTEEGIMTELGYTRVYDCGNAVWLWEPRYSSSLK